MKGLISNTLAWISHPAYSDENVKDWAAGLVLILLVSFLWYTVIRQLAEA